MTTTLTISKALKAELERIRDVRGLRSLNATIQQLLRESISGDRPVDGNDETLTEPVKVSGFTRSAVQRVRDNEGHRDYEDVLRDRAGIARRDTGEEPIDIRPL